MDYTAYIKAMEAKLCELEKELKDKGRKNAELFNENASLRKHIRELEEFVFELNDRNTQLKAYMLDYKEDK